MNVKKRHRHFAATVLKVTVGLATLLILLSSVDSLLVLGRFSLNAYDARPTDAAAAYAALSSASRVATLLLAMLISGMAIALPLAANNYTPRLIGMFTRDPINRTMFGLLLSFGAVSMWLLWIIRDGFFPPFSLRVCFLLFLVSQSAIVPYLFYLFSFLNPESILVRLRTLAERAITRAAAIGRKEQEADSPELQALKQEATERMDSIGNIARGTLMRSDRQAFIQALETLRLLETHYTKLKPDLPDQWFEVQRSFLAGMPPEARQAIERERLIFEVHLSNVLLGLIESAAYHLRDAVNDVAFIVYRVASTSLLKHDQGAAHRYAAVFNSTLRIGINTEDIRLIFNVLPHYRRIADDAAAVAPDFTLEIARRIYEYALMARDRGGLLAFTVELVAHELAKLIDVMSKIEDAPVQQVVALLLNLPTRREDEEPVLGVIKARLVAAAGLDPEGKSDQARELLKPACELSPETLELLENRFLADTPVLYWEITARQVNLDHIPDEIKDRVKVLLQRIREKAEAE